MVQPTLLKKCEEQHRQGLFAALGHCLSTHKPTTQTLHKTDSKGQLQVYAKYGASYSKTQHESPEGRQPTAGPAACNCRGGLDESSRIDGKNISTM